VVAYGRIPNLLGLLAMPKQGQLDAALRSEANIRNVGSIQQGLAQNVLALPELSDPRVSFLADVVRSPIEIAGFGTPTPSVLIGATLATRSAEEFNQLIAALGNAGPAVSLAAPLDGQGIGELAGLPLPAFVKFDPASGRLLLHSGPMVDRAAFEELLEGLPANLDDHPMYALENRIDASGQGMFVWADAARIVPLVAPDAMRQLGQAGLGGLRAVAFGFGTANDKGRLSLVVDVGESRQSRPFPVIANDIKATAVGDPDAAILVSIPGQEEVSRLQSMLLAALPPGGGAAWEQGKASFANLLGVEFEEIFSAIGPEIVFLFDQAGDYAAVRLRDGKLFDDIVRRITAKTGSGPSEHKAGGTTFWHWRLPSFFTFAASAFPGGSSGPGDDALSVLGRAREHVYWVREGEYLYLSQLPQPLIDRVNAGAKASVADWLEQQQRVDMSSSVFAATGSVSKMPRRSYEMYVAILQFLADVTEAEFDVWSMPTADQLALPDKGAIGFSFNLGEPYLSLELTYENHPGELLLGGGQFGGVAVAGILAAIAIPAYQDYTIRAQVTEGLNLASGIKAAVAESYATRGTVPRDRRAAGLPASPESTAGRYVEAIAVERGVITITYGNEANAVLHGTTLVMTPFATPNGDIVWTCGYAENPAGTRLLPPEGARQETTILPKYLPAACR
jgi:Tfp pilus assembly major pilin PilA